MIAIAVFAILSAAFMAPALHDCSHTVLGKQPSDGTSGGVWLAWNYSRVSVFSPTTPAIGGPHPGGLWQPEFISALVWVLPYSLLAKLVDPVCTWNIAIFFGFLLDGMAMFLLVRWLTRNPIVAFIAGYAYAFTPFHVEKSYQHIGYLYSWIFPLIVWAMIAFFQTPTRRRALLCGLAMATAGYTDGYYLLFAPVMAASIGIIGLMLTRRLPARIRDEYRRGTAVIFISGIALMLPIAGALVIGRDHIAARLSRPTDDLVTFSARPLDYLLPSHSHPLLGRLVSTYMDSHLHNSNYAEQSLYIGTIVLISAIVFVGLVVKHRWPGELDSLLPLPARFLAVTLGAAALIALVSSGPPLVLGLPMPSTIVHSLVPLWRVYARFYVVIDTLVVTLASLAWWRVARHRWGTLALGILFALIAFDLGTIRPAWSYTVETPPVYRWLGKVPGHPLIAEVPISPAWSSPDGVYRAFQPIHGKPMVNDAPTETSYAAAQYALLDINDPQTIPALRAMGVTYIVVHRQIYANPGNVTDLTDPTVTVAYRSPDDVVYRVGPGPVTESMVGIGAGFSFGQPFWPHVVRWSLGSVDLPIVSLRPTSTHRFRVGFTAASFGVARRVVASQNGRALWQGVITDTADVSVTTVDRSPVHLDISPGPTCVRLVHPDSPDTRCISLDVRNLSITPLADEPASH